MSRKEIALETVRYIEQGYYNKDGKRVDFADAQRRSEVHSRLFTPDQGQEVLRNRRPPVERKQAEMSLVNAATVKAILSFAELGYEQVGVLNFASAKNAGGGFLNGAMAQEESLAASSGLYGTQLKHEGYYLANRATRSMMYTDHAIYSPDVVFFRDERFQLLDQPVAASVLTLPAVNMGQVLLKGEDADQARIVMKDRMRLALSIFAHQGDRYIILGAYGCGVFRNDPAEVARWWQELLVDEGYGRCFDHVQFAILESSKKDNSYRAFEQRFQNAHI